MNCNENRKQRERAPVGFAKNITQMFALSKIHRVNPPCTVCFTQLSGNIIE